MNNNQFQTLSTQRTTLEQQYGRFLISSQFGQSWQQMSLSRQTDVLAYCEQIIGKPEPLKLSPLTPEVVLEVSLGRVWAVRVGCESEFAAYQFAKWATTVSALVAVQQTRLGWFVRCWGLNPLVWRQILDAQAG
ncbi:hypothetical protein [Synechococcus sp. PCC 6312]|uniref:hypothetical protein n=1 Tax=Synechococcus sp. (strain ATCC 27167 / PCC 6312) TaxID=195253 RepID=UPI00029EDF60|nr:hypothetical protein [Synechococcus sp. PCC 6312]AFY62024.1 hypothetical protein Syn6312_2965 [Synechococcus sp. PCC 6312]